MLHGFIDILVSQFSLQESANIRCLLSLCIEQAQPNASYYTVTKSSGNHKRSMLCWDAQISVSKHVIMADACNQNINKTMQHLSATEH